MALTQIGARIGIEGEVEYRKAMSSIITSSKQLASELKVLESSFTNNIKTVRGVNQEQEILGKQLTEAVSLWNIQNEALQKAKEQFGATSDEVKKAQTNLNNTSAEIANIEEKLRNLPSTLELVRDAWKNATSVMGETLVQIGSGLTKYVTAPLTAAAGLSVKTFADQQEAMTGVRKTVDEVFDSNGNLLVSYEDIDRELRSITLNTASSYESVAAAAEVAGQLGITAKQLGDGSTELGKFTKTMIMLGDTTNLSADEAATALARVLNITGESTDNIDKIGNAVVYLGNNFATSESEIVAMTNRLAAGGTLAGLTTQEILGLATAMSSVGITAEAGGTAMTQTLTAIEKEFSQFSIGAENNLPRIAEIAGMSAEEFADAWQNRPAQAIQAFISGLGSLDEKGESATLVLDELGMAGIRQSNMLKSLSLASDKLEKAIDGSNTAFAKGNDLVDEAQKRYGDFKTQTSQLKESMKYLGSEVGESLAKLLLPVVEKLTTFFTGLAESWAKLPAPIQNFVLGLLGLAAAIGPVLLVAGNLLIFIEKVKAAMTALEITGKALMLGVGKAALIIGGVVLAIVAVIEIIKHWDQIVEFAKNVIAAFGEAFRIFGELVVEIFKFVRDWIVEKVIEIKDNIVEKFTLAKQNAINLFENLKQGAINIFNNMKTGISNTIGNIKTAIVNGLTTAFNWIKSIPSQALNWGADIMKSMAQGIRNAIGWVTDAVSSVASRVKSFLHFSEPDVGPLSDFSTYMPDMMKLMAKGINDNSYLVENALSNVAGMMSGQINGNNPNVNYGGVNIYLNVPEGADGRMLVDQMETELANRANRRRAVFN